MRVAAGSGDATYQQLLAHGCNLTNPSAKPGDLSVPLQTDPLTTSVRLDWRHDLQGGG